MNWDAISGTCAIIGIGYYLYQFHYLPKVDLKEMRNNVLVQFKVSQGLINELIHELTQYSNSPGSSIYYSQGVTFDSYITYLQDLRAKELKEELYNDLSNPKSLPLSKDNLSLILTSLNNQILSFNQSLAYFKTTFKYSSFVYKG